MGVKQKFSKKHNRKIWGYDARIDGERRRVFGFSAKESAEVALSKARLEAFERKHGVAPPAEKPTVTVRALVERRAAQLQETCRRRASANVLERFLRTLPAGLLVTELTTAHLRAYVDLRLKVNQPQTVFRELTDLCSMLNNARDLFAALEDWTPTRRPRMKSTAMARDRLIVPDEAARLLAEILRPRMDGETKGSHSVRLDAADLFQIALLTAARRMEILSLRWTDVHFEWKTLRVTGTKTGQVRVIPMPDALVRLLGRRKAEAGDSQRVFPALEGSTLLRNGTNVIYKEASERALIPYGRDVAGGWVLHDARHTAITAMLHAGASLESVMAISGHHARVMALRYAHSTAATRRAAVVALDQFAADEPRDGLHPHLRIVYSRASSEGST